MEIYSAQSAFLSQIFGVSQAGLGANAILSPTSKVAKPDDEITLRRSPSAEGAPIAGYVQEQIRFENQRQNARVNKAAQAAPEQIGEVQDAAETGAGATSTGRRTPTSLSALTRPTIELSSADLLSLFASADAGDYSGEVASRTSGIRPNQIEPPSAFQDAPAPYDDSLLVASLYNYNYYLPDSVVPAVIFTS